MHGSPLCRISYALGAPITSHNPNCTHLPCAGRNPVGEVLGERCDMEHSLKISFGVNHWACESLKRSVSTLQGRYGNENLLSLRLPKSQELDQNTIGSNFFVF